MSYYPIDTHATVRKFEAAGIDTKQAEAIVKAMAWSRNDLVTKTDLAGFATKADLERFATKEDLAGFATKADLERFATKEDLAGFATKADLERFATKEDLAGFATKADLERFATKEDLAGFATKADLERFATKADLERFATKEDLAGFATKEDLVILRAEMAAMKSDLEKQISGAVNKMLICMISMSALIVGMMKYF